MRNYLKFAVMSAAVAGLLVSCDKTESEPDQTIDKTVAVFMPTHTYVARWQEDKAGLKSSLETQGVDYKFFMVEEDANGAVEQANQIKMAVKDGYKTLIIIPVDYNVLNSEKALANAADCNVICHDRLIMDNPNVDYFSTSNLQGVGKLQAECLIDAFEASGKTSMTLEMLAGPSADFNSEQFFLGADSLLSPYIAQGKMVVRSGRTTFEQVSIGQWNEDVARDTMLSILNAYYPSGQAPDLILAANDMCATGSIEALETLNPSISAYPVITGQDNTTAARQNIKIGKQTMTIDKSISSICVCTAGVAKAYVNGQTPRPLKSINNGSVNVALIEADVTPIYKKDIK